MRNLVRHTDGLGHVNLADMDMDAFREWLWPGVKAMGYMIDVTGNDATGFAAEFRRQTRFLHYRVQDTDNPNWFMVWCPATGITGAKRKAMAMVRDYLAKSHGPCAMTTGGNHGQE